MDVKEIFSVVKKAAVDTANWSAKKSGEVVEITKIKFEITKLEGALKDTFYEIGTMCYEGHKNGTALDYQEKFDFVEKTAEEIKELSKKLDEIKNVKTCPTCGEKVQSEAQFCFKCGKDL